MQGYTLNAPAPQVIDGIEVRRGQDAAELSILQGTEYLLNHAVDSVRCMSEGRAIAESFQMVIGPVLRQRSHALSVGRRRLYIFTKSKYVNGHR